MFFRESVTSTSPRWSSARSRVIVGLLLACVTTVDAQVPACGTIASGRRSDTGGERRIEVASSRHFVALSAARMQEWMASELSKLDLLVVQIDGIHMTGDLVLVAAIGIDGKGVKHPLGLIEGATENSAVVQALIDNLVARGLDPAVPRLFIIDGSKALSSDAV